VRGKHEWASIPVPTSKTSLLVTGLQAVTSYQFSVLAQNKLGSGPFSEIVTITTLGEHNFLYIYIYIYTYIQIMHFMRPPISSTHDTHMYLIHGKV